MVLPAIIQVFLRGGQDGLTWCAPAADPLYKSVRGALKIPRDPLGNIGSYFTLPPAAQVLKPLYQAGKLAYVHGAGLPFTALGLPKDRSHFNTQFRHETAGLTTNLATGWLARGMDRFSPQSTSLLRGLCHSNLMARVLGGASNTIATADPINYDLPPALTLALQKTALAGMYDASAEPLRGAASSALAAVELLNTVTFSGTGATDFERAMQNIGDIMLDPDLFPDNKRVIAFNVDLGGWDLHADLGPLPPDGNMHNVMTLLANQLAAFHNRFAFVGAPEYVLLCVTEFGRRFAPSASAGLDHGWGSVITVMGNQGVNGGNVFHSGWNPPPPPPPQHQTFPPPPPDLSLVIDADGDLRVTIDYRQVLAEALVDRFHVDPVDLGAIFPGLAYAPIGVFA